MGEGAGYTLASGSSSSAASAVARKMGACDHYRRDAGWRNQTGNR